LNVGGSSLFGNKKPRTYRTGPYDGAHLTAQAAETEAQLAARLSRRSRLVRRLGAMGAVFLTFCF
jgi:hypothetical protein